MKPFNLELAKQGHPVCTRDGHDARIICFDRKSDKYPIIALLSYDNGEEAYYYTSEGHLCYTSDYTDPHNLMMASVKREGWVNVYKGYTVDIKVFDTKDEALTHKCSNGYLATVKIKWEE